MKVLLKKLLLKAVNHINNANQANNLIEKNYHKDLADICFRVYEVNTEQWVIENNNP